MKGLTRVVFVALLVLVGVEYRGDAEGYMHMQLTGSIQGRALRVIQAALPAFEEKGLKLDECEVRVYERRTKPSYFVIFDDPDRPEGLLGGAPGFPTFEVEVDKNDLHIVHSSFSR